MAKTQQDIRTSEVEGFEACQRCGNNYIIIWLREGEEYNDFYIRHCPFCGLCTDQLTGSIET